MFWSLHFWRIALSCPVWRSVLSRNPKITLQLWYFIFIIIWRRNLGLFSDPKTWNKSCRRKKKKNESTLNKASQYYYAQISHRTVGCFVRLFNCIRLFTDDDCSNRGSTLCRTGDGNKIEDSNPADQTILQRRNTSLRDRMNYGF